MRGQLYIADRWRRRCRSRSRRRMAPSQSSKKRNPACRKDSSRTSTSSSAAYGQRKVSRTRTPESACARLRTWTAPCGGCIPAAGGQPQSHQGCRRLRCADRQPGDSVGPQRQPRASARVPAATRDQIARPTSARNDEEGRDKTFRFRIMNQPVGAPLEARASWLQLPFEDFDRADTPDPVDSKSTKTLGHCRVSPSRCSSYRSRRSTP